MLAAPPRTRLRRDDEAERGEIALLYRRIVRAIDGLYDTPTPYIAAWHQAPVRGRPRHRSG